jgi:hypothetical protein
LQSNRDQMGDKKEGGLREKMTKARINYRKKGQ